MGGGGRRGAWPSPFPGSAPAGRRRRPPGSGV